ncbi:snaclec bothroinsularin subunit alpha-like [Paramormyrops kingsleyae]|uniref:snaclec bothroinsularin subunit alpha-like n=1 Tax=Paramormyrops kingsleyae TaxID=1676925 RepID=UPI003B96BFAE
MKLVAFLTLLCLLAVNAQELQGRQFRQCKDRRLRNWYKVGSYCVKFFDEYLDFNTARTRCQATNTYGELLSVHSLNSNNLVIRLSLNGYYAYSWLGGFLKGASWVWTDGTQFDYSNMARGPDKTGQQCIAIKGNGSWVPMSCDRELPFYCGFRDQ